MPVWRRFTCNTPGARGRRHRPRAQGHHRRPGAPPHSPNIRNCNEANVRKQKSMVLGLGARFTIELPNQFTIDSKINTETITGEKGE
jgi:hypothetical protein